MATLAADSIASVPETRRTPAAITYFSDVFIAGGAIVLFVTACVAKAYSTDDNHVLDRFWHAYLLAVSYGASLSIGGLFFVLAHHLTGGRWGTSLRRLAELVAGTMIISAALFLPILGNIALESDSLYEWNNPAHVEGDSVLEAKAAYLDPTWFIIRTVGYFVLWCTIAWYFVQGSLKQDETGEVAPLRRLSKWSGPSMVLFCLTLNFAAFDWLMSLAPHWFSTMFGVYFFTGSFVGFLSLLMLMALFLQSQGVLSQSITVDNRHDVAKLMYAFIIFWGYIAFSQFMLIWYANVPEETEWFSVRQVGETSMFGMPTAMNWLFILHLFVPFLGFMSATLRRNKAVMGFWAGYLLVIHWLDLVFIVMPGTNGYEDYAPFEMIGPFEIICTLGVIAVLVGAIMRGAEGKWLLPVRDPRLKQSMTYHNH